MPAEINISLPDGTAKRYPAGVTAWEVAESLGPRLAREALASKINGRTIDLYIGIQEDASVEIITPSHPESLRVLRHTASHVLAQAVKELFPEAKMAGGPPTEDGFYYDFDKPTPFTEDDLVRIERRMAEIVKRDLEVRRKELPREEAIRFFDGEDEPYKVYFAREKGGEIVSTYRQEGFTDFCTGPHLPSTGRVAHFKLLSTAGAYWLGSEKNKMLQRIYGTAFWRKQDLETYLQRMEEARKRDHRRLGKDLDLFSIHEDLGTGLIYWHPRGARLRLAVEDYSRAIHALRGYEFVQTPQIARAHLWKTSGHFDYYRDNMYTLDIDKDPYVLKPMNCPEHISIFTSRRRSYRELPLRFYELGTVHRYERTGTLHGLLRVRGFTQDDAHIFCTPDQIEAEIAGVLDLTREILETFGFNQYEVELSVRDPGRLDRYAGEDREWRRAETALERVLKRQNLPVRRMEGEAVFYGPKIDVKLVDALGRKWQTSTVQFDFNLPRRFGVTYTGPDGAEHTAVMVHRAIFGSLERFIGTLIEHFGGAFPLWLAPVQAIFIPITDRSVEASAGWAGQMRAAGLRVELDRRSEKLGYKIRDAQMQKIPLMFIVGDREVEEELIAVRSRDRGDLGTARPLELIRRLVELNTQRRQDLDLSGLMMPPMKKIVQQTD
ncbi:MAG: threonine--tRNA ligase [Acidobacteriota bacterium]